jgi:glycosyltransferase 2 family protein
MEIPQKKSSYIKYIKLFISISLIAFLFFHIDFEILFIQIRATKLPLFFLALGITILRYVVGVFRWKSLIWAKGISVRFSYLLRAYFVSSFYNLIFPSVLGGDVVRAYMVSKKIGNKNEGVSSVIMERLLGFFSLAIIALIALALGYELVSDFRVRLFVIALFAGFIFLFFVLFNRKLMGFFFSIFSFIKLSGIKKKLDSFYEIFYQYGKEKRALWFCLLLSLVYQLIGIVVVYFIGLSINIDLPFVYYLVFIPLIWVVMMVPISISGIGLRESGFVFFFMKAGVSKESALLLSLLFFSQTVIMGFIGLVVKFIPEKREVNDEENTI